MHQPPKDTHDEPAKPIPIISSIGIAEAFHLWPALFVNSPILFGDVSKGTIQGFSHYGSVEKSRQRRSRPSPGLLRRSGYEG